MTSVIFNNINLYLILHLFQVIADYLSNLLFRQGRGTLFNTLVRREPVNLRPWSLASRN